MNETLVWELPGVARIISSFAGGAKFERLNAEGFWRPCQRYVPLMGMTKGQARACRKALRREGFSAHLRRSL